MRCRDYLSIFGVLYIELMNKRSKDHLLQGLLALLFILTTTVVMAQDDDPFYYELEDYPEDYTSGLVAARLVDGLGLRFYWATDSLTEENLQYRPSEGARTLGETVDHIYNLTAILLNATKEQPTQFPIDISSLTFNEKREAILASIQQASAILQRSGDEDFKKYKIVFQYANGGSREYPFWNLLNGPIADALWHTGQVVSFRRSAGNPFDGSISVLAGKVRKR